MDFDLSEYTPPAHDEIEFAFQSPATESLTWESQTDWDAAQSRENVVTRAIGDRVADEIRQGYDPNYPPVNDAVAYWPFDSGTTTAEDVIGGYDGVVNGATPGATGILSSNAIDFDYSAAVNDVSVDAMPLADPSSSWTANVWVHLTAGGTHQLFFSVEDSVAQESLGMGLWDDNTTKIYSAGRTPGSGSSFTANEWRMMTLRWDGTTAELFVDGTFDYSVAPDGGGSIIAGADQITLGNRRVGASDPPAGRVDEPMLFNRALTDAEIAALYDVVSSGSLTTAPLAGEGGAIEIDTSASVPTGTSVSVTVNQDETGNGVADTQQTVAIGDGASAVELTGFANAQSDYWLDVDLSTTDPETTAAFDTASVEAQIANVGSTSQEAHSESSVRGTVVHSMEVSQVATTDSAVQGAVAHTGSTMQSARTESATAGSPFIGLHASGEGTGTAQAAMGAVLGARATGEGTGVVSASLSQSVGYEAHGEGTGAAFADATYIEEAPDLRWEGAGVSPLGVSSFGVGYRPDVVDAFTNYIIVLDRPQSRDRPSEDREEQLILTDSDFESIRASRRKNAIGDFSISVPGRTDLHEWVGADVRILYRGDLIFYGRYEDYGYSKVSHKTDIEGFGIGTKLKDSQSYVQYQNVPAVDAIENYWERTRFEADVYDPPVSTVFEDQQLADVSGKEEFQEAFDITDTEPLEIQGRVGSNGQVNLLQSCFFMNAPSDAVEWGNDDNDQEDGTSIRTSDGQHYNDGAGIQLTNIGDYVEFEFTPEYTMPHIRVGVRMSGQDEPEVKAYLNGQEIGTPMEAMGEHYPEPEWIEVRQFGENLQSIGGSRGESYTLRLEVESLDPVYAGGFAAVDVVAPFDLRFNYDWPVAVNSDGYLDGPQLYPDAYSIMPEELETEANITQARLSSSWNNVAGKQELALSNDRGTTFEPQRNTHVVDVDFESYGYSLLPRFTFSRYGEQSDEGPSNGIYGQQLFNWELIASGNDLRVISEMELQNDHLRNLQDLHELAGLWFTIHHDPTLNKATTYPPNEEALESDFPIPMEEWDDYSESRSMAYTRVVVQGRRREDGSRRIVERQNREAIIDAGGDPDDPDDPTGKRTFKYTDPRLETMDDVRNKAGQLIAELTSEVSEGYAGKLTGKINTEPRMLEPGFSYYVEEWDRTLPLDTIRYQDSLRQSAGTYDFEENDGLTGRLAQLRAESTTWRNLL